jgi:hypothetical protein
MAAAWRASLPGTLGAADQQLAGILSPVSCPSASFCMAVDTNGYALRWNGVSWSQPTWSAPRQVDQNGGGLTAVSCRPGGYCVATDYDGQVQLLMVMSPPPLSRTIVFAAEGSSTTALLWLGVPPSVLVCRLYWPGGSSTVMFPPPELT